MSASPTGIEVIPVDVGSETGFDAGSAGAAGCGGNTGISCNAEYGIDVGMGTSVKNGWWIISQICGLASGFVFRRRRIKFLALAEMVVVGGNSYWFSLIFLDN